MAHMWVALQAPRTSSDKTVPQLGFSNIWVGLFKINHQDENLIE